MIAANEFRRVMRHVPAAVTVVTTRHADGRPRGLTVSAFSSVSLEPTLVMVCIDRRADSHDCVAASGIFAVNLLGAETGESLSRRFAGELPGEKFTGVAYRRMATGAPVLEAAVGWLDCRVVQAVPAGDHTIYVGEVLAADVRDEEPLIYHRGGYGSLAL